MRNMSSNKTTTTTTIDLEKENSIKMSDADDRKVSCVVHGDMEQQFLSVNLLQYVLIPLIDARVLHYLKCTNSTWKKHIEEYIEESAPKFEFVTKFGSKGSGNGEFNSP